MAELSMDERAVLFNCCTEYKEPDWTSFEYLELAGCRNDNDPEEDETNIIGNIEVHLAEFFTVYGRDSEGLAEAITDTKGNSAKLALDVAAALSLRSGLKCIVAPSLMIGRLP